MEEPQQCGKRMELVEVLGIEPRASCMLSTRSTTELHPLVSECYDTVPCYFLKIIGERCW